MRAGFEQLGLNSIGVPLVGTGLAGIPLDESMNDLLEALKAFATSSAPPNGLERTIYIVNNDRTMIESMKKLIDEKLQYASGLLKVKNEATSEVTGGAGAAATASVGQSFQAGVTWNFPRI